MDEIEKRLRDVSDTCVEAYLKWQGQRKNPDLRESLQDAIHELRKVTARLEIEIAVSEREEMTARPLPIPPHRSTRKQRQGGDEDSSEGNTRESEEERPQQSSGAVRQGLRRRSQGPARSAEE